MVPRVAQKAVTLQASNGKTYPLPTNTSIIVNMAAVHYNETYWPNADQFNPSRFMGQDEKEEARMDASFWLCVV